MLQIIYHEAYLTRYLTSVAESPDRVKAIHGKLSQYYPTVTPAAADRQDILRVHSAQLLARVRAAGKEVYQTALLSAGGALCAAQLACCGAPAFAIIRPPGHHASNNRYGRFCFFNNMAVAIAFLLDANLIRGAVIIDIDMHDGDGTSEIFRQQPAVSIIDIRERDRNGFLSTLQKALEETPATDLVAVCAGFDLYLRDWGGMLETADFHRIGHWVQQLAHAKASGRYFAILEGGYYLNDLGKNALAFCRGLEGITEMV